MCALADDERRQAEYTLERMLGEIERIKAAERRRREMEERLLQQMNESEGQLREAKAEEVLCLVYASCGAAEHLLWLRHDGGLQWHGDHGCVGFEIPGGLESVVLVRTVRERDGRRVDVALRAPRLEAHLLRLQRGVERGLHRRCERRRRRDAEEKRSRRSGDPPRPHGCGGEMSARPRVRARASKRGILSVQEILSTVHARVYSSI